MPHALLEAGAAATRGLGQRQRSAELVPRERDGALADGGLDVVGREDQQALEGLVGAGVVGWVGGLACVLVPGEAEGQQGSCVLRVRLDGSGGLVDEHPGLSAGQARLRPHGIASGHRPAGHGEQQGAGRHDQPDCEPGSSGS